MRARQMAIAATTGLSVLALIGVGSLVASPVLAVINHVMAVPLTRRLAGETLKLAGLCTVISLLLGAPLAWALRLGTERARHASRLAAISPFLLGLLARATGFLVVLGEFGLVNLVLRTMRIEADMPRTGALLGELAVLGGMVQVFAPFMVLALYRAMTRIDIGTVRALRSLGLSHPQIFARVAVPLSLGGAATGVATVFALATGAYVTVAVFGGRRVQAVAGLAYDESETLIGWQVAAVAIVLAGLGLVVLARWLAGAATGQRPNRRPAAPRTST